MSHTLTGKIKKVKRNHNQSNQNTTIMSNTKHKISTKRWQQKIKEKYTKIIQFMNKSREYIIQAIDRLKKKYKNVVVASIKEIGAGLCTGTIKLG